MITRSKIPVVYDRNGNQSKIVVDYDQLIFNKKTNKWTVNVHDSFQREIPNPKPGERLFSYHKIKGTEKSVDLTNEKIKTLFDALGQPIIPGETSFPAEIARVMPFGILAITQEKPIYGTTAGDWEIIDETAEIAPNV